MSSPTLTQKLTAEAIGTAILVFIGAGSVPLTVFLTGRRTRSAAPSCRRSRSRSPSRSSRRSTRSATSAAATSTRPSRSPCWPPARSTTRPPVGYIGAQLVGAFLGAGLTLIILSGNDPADARPRRRLGQRQGRPRDRLRGRGHRHGDPRVHGLRCRRRRPGARRASPASSSASSSTGSSSSSARSPAPRSTRPARSAPSILGLAIGAKTHLRPAAARLHRRPDRRRPRRRLRLPVHRPQRHGHRARRRRRRARARGRLSRRDPDRPTVTTDPRRIPWPRTHPAG